MGLLLIPLAAAAALVYYCKRKRSCKAKKLLEDEAGGMREEQMVTMASYSHLTGVNSAVTPNFGSQETNIMENPRVLCSSM